MIDQVTENQVLTEEEILAKLMQVKKDAGSHSPSINTILDNVPEINLNVDACFLSNPYATELFIKYFEQDLLGTKRIRDVLEFYPSQNKNISSRLSSFLDVPTSNIFIGNGAIEIIQGVIHNFVSGKIIVNIPTFSSYYEFALPGQNVVYYKLKKEDNYCLDIDDYLRFIRSEKPDTVVLINPNNPDGGYIPYSQLEYLVSELEDVENVIIDESFIHFAYEDSSFNVNSAVELSKKFPNVLTIKSMSKDFGLAGVRAGYAVMSEKKVDFLLNNGYLWNSNGIAEYFFELYTREDFLKEYEIERIRYIMDFGEFVDQLIKLPNIKVLPTMANFVLLELLEGSESMDFVFKLLVRHGVYTRTCYDKIGLDGQYIRIGGRTKDENDKIISGISQMLLK